jgi:hypothetical protein
MEHVKKSEEYLLKLFPHVFTYNRAFTEQLKSFFF